MRTGSSSPQVPRAGRPWLVPVALAIVILGITAYLLTRTTSKPELDSPTAPALGGKSRPVYENRAVWRTSGTQPPAATRIRGTVYDTAGLPIVGARVTASTFRVAGNRSNPAASASSDGDGRFELPLPDGTYYLTGEREGFGPAMIMANGGDDVGLVLPRSGVIGGHVVDENGQPVSRFTIDVISPSTDDLAAPTPFATKRFDSADGSYQISELPDRRVFLRVAAPGHAPAISDPVQIEPGKSETKDFTLNTGCVMSGVVKDDTGAPVPEVLVNAELRRSAGMMGTSSVDATSMDESDAEGRFELENVPIGDVMIRAYDGEHAVTTATLKIEDCEGIAPLELRMTAGGGLEGVVRDAASQPVAGARLTLSHRSIGFVNTTSDAEGRYRFDRLPAGGMRLQAMRSGQHTTTFVAIPEGERVEQDVAFSSGGTGEIRGRVTSGDRPLAGMALTVITSVGKGILGSHHPVTGEDGTYRVTGLADGVYAVLIGSVNRVTQAHVEDGGVVTADVDIARPIERKSLQRLKEEVQQSQPTEEP